MYELKLTLRLVFPSAAFQGLGLSFKHSFVVISHFYCSTPPKHEFPFHHSFFLFKEKRESTGKKHFLIFILAS